MEIHYKNGNLENGKLLHFTLPLHCQVFASMDELLRKAPMVYSIASRSRSELHRQWQEWRSECTRRRDSGEFVAVEGLHNLVKVSQANRLTV